MRMRCLNVVRGDRLACRLLTKRPVMADLKTSRNFRLDFLGGRRRAMPVVYPRHPHEALAGVERRRLDDEPVSPRVGRAVAPGARWQRPWQHRHRPNRPIGPDSWTIWTHRTLGGARLRARSRITGWRFESASAQRESPASRWAFRWSRPAA